MTIKEELEILKGSGGWDYKSEVVKPEDAQYGNIFKFRGRKPFDWRSYLPPFEDQKRTAFCLSYSYLNCQEIRIIHKMLEQGYKIEDILKIVDFSDRWLGVKSNTSFTGNTFGRVSEAARKEGLIKEKYCSWKPEWLENPRQYWNAINDLSDVPTDVKRYYRGNLYHAWVYPRLPQLKDALANSPLWIGVGLSYNWEDEVVYPPKSYQAYHAITLLYIDDKYKYVYDSLGRSLKKLTLNYPILSTKVFPHSLPEDWKQLNMPFKLLKEKDKNQIYAEISGALFWICPVSMFNRLRDNGVIGDWGEIEELDKLPSEPVGVIAETSLQGITGLIKATIKGRK